MKIISSVVLGVCLAAGSAQAQVIRDVQIRVAPYTQSHDGGEKALGLSYGINPLTIGKTLIATFSWKGGSCHGWMVSGGQEVMEDATTAWRIELTPKQVAGDVVVFRMRSARFESLKRQSKQFSFETNSGSPVTAEDVELMLRPGESSVVDTVQVTEASKADDNPSCGNLTTLRVGVEPYPSEGEEKRLVGAELWLVERLANGSAPRSQPLTLRSLPNHAVPFYFDRVGDGQASLDVYGVLKPRVESGRVNFSIDTRIRSNGPTDRPGAAAPVKSIDANFAVAPEEIVEVQLPPIDEGSPFAKRHFSIRIRARQLR